MNEINYFLPRQVWQYETRCGEENSTLTILKIDELENDAIIHIRIDDVKVGNTNCIQHMPLSADAITASLTGFVKHLDALPAFEAGYEQWKQAFETGKAGYWKMAVKDVVEAVDTLMQKGE